MNSGYQGKEAHEIAGDCRDDEMRSLIVYNDDFNTFAHVIATLIRVCRHSQEQAEQCTWIIHYTGKCSVRSGTFGELKPMAEAIREAGIDAKIK